MAKGIESLLMSQGARGDRPETVKPGITELPVLPPYTPETGSIDLINWVTHITPIMEDLSDSSSLWWSDTLREVMLWYSKYSVATPLERIQLLPVVSSSASKPEWARVERRATAMMLTAIPASLKEEVIAAGGVNTLNLLAKLFSTYQPGNRQEKALVLANLERPGECQDAATAVEALRKWALWRKCAMAIGITEPDSSVLLQGLDRICSAVVRADPELAFRVSLIQSTLQVDVNPTSVSVTKFFQHLQAELEQQARLGASRGVELNPRLKKVGFDGATEAVVKVMAVLQEVKKVDGFSSLVSTVDKWVKNWGGFTSSKPALMDSGATHSLRPPRDEQEWKDAMKVGVALAGDSKTVMRQNAAGTLLSGDELTQVIVPLGRVITSLGYNLRWTATECCLERGAGERIPLQVVRGCPEVDEPTAQQLIDELERCQVPQLQEATLDSVKILKNVEVSWRSCLLEYVVSGNVESGKEALRRAMFFDEREHEDLSTLLLRQPGDGGWGYMKDLGLNRRTRKRLMRASTWIVRWDPPGFTRKSDVLQGVGRLSEVAYLNVGSLLAQGQCYRGSTVPRFLVERRRGANVDSLDWMCDGKAQRYCDEMCLSDPMFREEESIEIVNGLTGAVYGAGGRIKLSRMSQDAAWRLHVTRNHQPFRRDCAPCVRNAATGKQHRATLHPTGYTLSIDLAGPLRGAGKSPDGKYFKYFLVGEPEVDDDPVLSDEDQEEAHLEEEEDMAPVAEERREQEEWQRLKEKFKAPLMTETLYFCVPMNSKKSLHILPALQQMVVDVRGLGYPVTRYYEDHFYRVGGRILLDAAELGREHWPTAIQSVYVKTNWRCGKYEATLDAGEIPGTLYRCAWRLDDVAPPILVDSEDPPPLPAPLEPPDADQLKKLQPNIPEINIELNALPPYPTGPPITYSPPGTRVRGKSPGVRMRALRDGDYEDMCESLEGDDGEVDQSLQQEEIMMKVLKAQEKQAVEAVARELLAAGDFSKAACQRLMRALGGFHTRWKTPRTSEGQGMVLGAYVRGGSFGVTTHGREMPYTMRFLNKFLLVRLQYTMPGSTSNWTTLAVQRANEIPAHRDVHNQKGTRNYVMEIADESLEGLWVEGTEESHQVQGGDGLSYPHEYQTPDGQVHYGRVHSIDEPVAFDPRSRHAMVNEPGMKWVLSAYTPSGVQRLLQADVELFVFSSQGFPVTGTGVALPTVRAIQRVSYSAGASWETTPMEEAPSFWPQFVASSGSQAAGAREEVEAHAFGDDGDEAEGEWELFVEDSEESCIMERDSECGDESLPRLRALCSTVDPGPEYELLRRRYEGHLDDEKADPGVQEEMAANLEEWELAFPRIAKVEPEYTEDIEGLISGLVEPLRHTHNVSPKEVRAAVERWRKSIEKELRVVEKGFYRTDVEGVRKLRRTHQIQELPAKLVYTIKPPAEDAVPGTEEAKCKRKARIVRCGNFNEQDPGEVFASGAAAESLQCALTLAALRRWAAGGLDIGGAFMLTPLPQDKVLFATTPPAILVQLGLATATERWILTRAMYGLRQAPRLWSEFRDEVVKKMRTLGWC
ncbi:unnamed protein product [Symbiodinium necroappetens]|uniref:Copia protein n=1 Tax=Symbiodinium necroappetens TaxID=1628268 RepID=A0A812W6Z2_9DINO|nr:unnamed protein product [Symbiodinium necroappetens]